jgi:hypothetical protein
MAHLGGLNDRLVNDEEGLPRYAEAMGEDEVAIEKIEKVYRYIF